MSLALFLFGLLSLLLALNARFPVRWPGELVAFSFAPAWWYGELPLHVTLCTLLGLGLGLALDAHQEPLGAWGLALGLLSLLAPLYTWLDARRAQRELETEHGPIPVDLPWWRLLFPFLYSDPEVLERPHLKRERDGLHADLYLPRQRSAQPAPLLLYVHGGAWVMGLRRWQGRIFIRRMVKAGWVCVSVEYRLSPRATWPAQIIDVKQAISWAKSMAFSWGADPERLVISGNSAGGHLASLAALTPNLGLYQPGFESDDTQVAGLVSWYGVYDLVNRDKTWPHNGLRRLWELLIVKRRLRDALDAFEQASPITHTTGLQVPALIVHGGLDTLVPTRTAEAFHRALENAAPGQSELLLIHGAQHSFDVFWSRRAVLAAELSARWLEQRFPVPPPTP